MKMIELDGEKYFSPKEAAAKLGISIGRIAQLRKLNALKAIRVSERKFLFSEKAIRDYVLFSSF